MVNLLKPTNEEWKQLFHQLENNQGISYPTEHGEYFVDHFIDCLPPIIWGTTYVLCSEPYSHTFEGKGTYIGFYKKNDQYYGVITTIEEFKKLL
jgi:hypothetical protein